LGYWSDRTSSRRTGAIDRSDSIVDDYSLRYGFIIKRREERGRVAIVWRSAKAPVGSIFAGDDVQQSKALAIAFDVAGQELQRTPMERVGVTPDVWSDEAVVHAPEQ
jgi:hypothetical protein